MSISEFTIKQNDTLEAIVAILDDSAGSAFSLAGATVVFSMRSLTTNVLIIDNVAATIMDAALRKVKYDWVTGDTVIAGDYLAEFEVTFSDGKIQTFPNGLNAGIVIHIIPQVG